MANILVFVEQREGNLKRFSLEALSEARRLADAQGGKVAAVMAGSAEIAGRCTFQGTDCIYYSNHPALSQYSTEGYSELVVGSIRNFQPDIVLAAASAMGKDLLPRVAARLDVALAQDCTGISWNSDSSWEFIRPIFAGKAFAVVQLVGVPQVATLRPNVFPVLEPVKRAAELIVLDEELKLDEIRARVREVQKFSGQAVELTEADIIVSGGRGMKGPENFRMVQELAESLGAAVGASRAVVDAGWMEHRFQVGQTGKTVAPSLYVACGISGAIQHLAGMSSSKYIIAINKDPEAPIFKIADYGIVGDSLQVLPLLSKEIKKIRQNT